MIRRRGEIVVALRVGLTVAVVEHLEFEFGSGERHHAALGETRHLCLQDGSRSNTDGRPVMVTHIGDNQRCAGEPRDQPERRHVGSEDQVAVPGPPARQRVAVDGRHVDIDREEVIAAFDAVFDHLVEEETNRHPLADQATLHVAESHDHRVDLACGRQIAQVVNTEQAISAECQRVHVPCYQLSGTDGDVSDAVGSPP